MNTKKLIKKTLVSACVIFTVVTALYMLILQIINISNQSAAVEAGRVLLFFVFSILLSCANAILSVKKLHAALRYIAHYMISTFGFWTCFCLPNAMDASKTLVGIVLFTLGYAIVMAIYAFVKSRIKKATATKDVYEKQFSGKKKSK